MAKRKQQWIFLSKLILKITLLVLSEQQNENTLGYKHDQGKLNSLGHKHDQGKLNSLG